MKRKVQLLILEDHTAVRNALKLRLRAALQMKVVAITSQTDVEKLDLNWQQPVVVLLGAKNANDGKLDLMLRTIGDFRRHGAAVIVLAAYADEVERELVSQAGACRYLLKDINTPQLIAEIEAVAAEAALNHASPIISSDNKPSFCRP